MRRLIAVLRVRPTLLAVPGRSLQRLLARLRSRRRPAVSGVPVASPLAGVDFSWFAPLEESVFAEHVAAAAPLYGDLAPLLSLLHRGVRVSVDEERGSLLLEFVDGAAWRFSVVDVVAAAQIAAASRLGGLLLRLSVGDDGLVRIHGVWERFSYVLAGVPVRDPLRA